jgi:hypothetical protein
VIAWSNQIAARFDYKHPKTIVINQSSWGRLSRIEGSGRFLKKAVQKLSLNWAGGGETSLARRAKIPFSFVHTLRS